MLCKAHDDLQSSSQKVQNEKTYSRIRNRGHIYRRLRLAFTGRNLASRCPSRSPAPPDLRCQGREGTHSWSDGGQQKAYLPLILPTTRNPADVSAGFSFRRARYWCHGPTRCSIGQAQALFRQFKQDRSLGDLRFTYLGNYLARDCDPRIKSNTGSGAPGTVDFKTGGLSAASSA